MELAGFTSWEQLATATPFSRSTLKDLGTPRGAVDEKHLRPIAAACNVPYAWFTVPDLAAAVRGADEEPTIAERMEAVESQLAALRRQLGTAATADDLADLVDATRRSTALHAEAADADLADQAAPDTRAPADATPEDPPARRAGRRHSGSDGAG